MNKILIYILTEIICFICGANAKERTIFLGKWQAAPLYEYQADIKLIRQIIDQYKNNNELMVEKYRILYAELLESKYRLYLHLKESGYKPDAQELSMLKIITPQIEEAIKNKKEDENSNRYFVNLTNNYKIDAIKAQITEEEKLLKSLGSLSKVVK